MASPSMSDSGSASNQKETVMNLSNAPTVAILGTGMYGRALETLLRESAGLDVRVGSRTPTGDQMTSYAAVEGASIVFLAVPPNVHESVINKIGSSLRSDALLVDISNHPLCAPPPQNAPTSIAEKLQLMVPVGVRVAKAFNTLSSYALEDTRRSHIVRIACDDVDAVDKLSLVCARAGLTPVYEGKLNDARHLEKIPHRLFPTWRFPVIVSVVVLAWWILYNTLAGFVILGGTDPTTPSREWRKWPLETFMSATGEASMTMFALTFIPGPVAGLVQLFRKSASKPLGKFFGTWLDARKELGLAAFFYASWHTIAGAVMRSHLRNDSEWKECK